MKRQRSCFWSVKWGISQKCLFGHGLFVQFSLFELFIDISEFFHLSAVLYFRHIFNLPKCIWIQLFANAQWDLILSKIRIIKIIILFFFFIIVLCFCWCQTVEYFNIIDMTLTHAILFQSFKSFPVLFILTLFFYSLFTIFILIFLFVSGITVNAIVR